MVCQSSCGAGNISTVNYPVVEELLTDAIWQTPLNSTLNPTFQTTSVSRHSRPWPPSSWSNVHSFRPNPIRSSLRHWNHVHSPLDRSAEARSGRGEVWKRCLAIRQSSAGAVRSRTQRAGCLSRRGVGSQCTKAGPSSVRTIGAGATGVQK